MSSVHSERFTLSIAATRADIDELGHVSNQVYLRWVLEAATAHSASVGFSHHEYCALGGAFVVRRHELDYLAPVLVGHHLRATTWIGSLRAASCVRATEIARDGEIVFRAATTWVFTSLSTGRPRGIPDQLRAAFRPPI